MHDAFRVHMLNERGKSKARTIAEAFDDLLARLEQIQPIGPSGRTREHAIVITKLEEAAFFSKKEMANDPANCETVHSGPTP